MFITGICFRFGGTNLSYQYIILLPELVAVSSSSIVVILRKQ